MLRNLFSAALLVLSVTAASGTETLQQRVSIGDLNLNRPAGQAAAQARIRTAAVRLCSSMHSTADLWRSTNLRTESDRDCIARAIERANAQIANARMAN